MPSNSLLWMIFGNHWLLITDITTTGCPNKLLTDFWGQCWETKFWTILTKPLGHPVIRIWIWLSWAILGHFIPLWPNYLVSHHGPQTSVSNFFQDWSESNEMLSKIFTYQLLPIGGVDLSSEDMWPSDNLEAGLINHYWSSKFFLSVWISSIAGALVVITV